jgi:iron complex transport system substrate-binding protein
MRRIAAFVMLLAALLPAAAAPVAVRDDAGVEQRFAAPPQRIVSLLPSLTETVCELRACARLVGVDRSSNWPASVQALPRLGGLEDAQVERIVALRPDVVLMAGSTRASDRLRVLGLRVLALEPRSLADTRRVVGVLAALLGDPAAGDALWQRLQTRFDDAAARVPPALRGRGVYLEVASTPYAAGQASYLGELLARLGLHSVVPAALGPFPQLNPEWVVRAQPDIVVATAQALAGMPARPGWDRLTALAEHRVCGFDTARWDTLMRPGPRLGDAAGHLADCLADLPEAAITRSAAR